MSRNDSQFEQSIASLVEVTDAFLRGEYSEDLPEVDAEGLLSTLAQRINSMLINMKNVEVPLSHAGEQTPNVVSHAHDVVQLMEQSTNEVLDKADRVILHAEEMEGTVSDCDQSCKEPLTEMKRAMYDIIASQSYQDAARQKMDKMITDLNQIRDWLIEVLMILNIKNDGSSENMAKKKELLREVHASSKASPTLKQDLVDDLLSEFGF